MNKIKNPENFRDLGGISGANGKKIAYKKLLRSGQLYGLSDKEKDVLYTEYNLRHIIDLRDNKELVLHPDSLIPGVSFHHINVKENDKEYKSTDANTFVRMKDPDEVDKYMREFYASMISSEYVSKKFQEMIKIYETNKEGAVIIHCFAGKDRTGISVAVLLTILGVSREDIFKDYMETNNKDNLKDSIDIMLKRSNPVKGSLEEKAIYRVMMVDKSYLESSYKQAETLYGSFEEYIKKGLKITEEQIQKIRDLYLVNK